MKTITEPPVISPAILPFLTNQRQVFTLVAKLSGAKALNAIGHYFLLSRILNGK